MIKHPDMYTAIKTMMKFMALYTKSFLRQYLCFLIDQWSRRIRENQSKMPNFRTIWDFAVPENA